MLKHLNPIKQKSARVIVLGSNKNGLKKIIKSLLFIKDSL